MSTHKTDKKNLFEQVFRHQAKDRLERFREYTLDIESKFSTDKRMLSDSFLKAIEGLNESERREVEYYFFDDNYIIEEIQVDLYRKSTLVSVYSFLENSLNTLCRHLYKRYGYPVELEDLRGNGIVRARRYLEKLADIDFSFLNKEWDTILAFNKVRNCIVHSEGNIKESRNLNKLENIVNETPGLNLRDERHIKVDREYIDATITNIEKFVDKLHHQVFTKDA